jgi:iron complex transport system substrate-binding protein
MTARALVVITLAWTAGCDRFQNPPRRAEKLVDIGAPLVANIREGRVRQFIPDLDYFPEKTSFRYSKQIRIDYHGNYKVLTISPAPNEHEAFRYVLVQRGTPAPPLHASDRVIEVPVENFILAHPELLGAAEILGLADRLVGLSQISGIRAPGVRAQIDRGRIARIGSGSHVDVERVIQIQPDVVLTYWSVSPKYDAHPVLDQAGIRTVVMASHWETNILATAEWMKVMAVLFNREAEANAVFGGIADRYEKLAARARVLPNKPIVLNRLPFRHIWYVVPPPDEVADAGGEYFWKDATRPKGIDIETVAQHARNANVWLVAFPTPMRTVDEFLAREPRLQLFRAVRTRDVWNYDLPEVRPDLPYHDRRMRPDLVLADMVKILHPELVPNHEFVFFRRLDIGRTGP